MIEFLIRHHASTHARRGTILVAVLWLLIFLGFLAVTLRIYTSSVVISVRTTEDRETIRVLGDAGLALAAALVRAGPVDGVGQLPDILQGQLQLNGADIAVTVQNEVRRIDLNTAARPLVEAGLVAAGLKRSEAQRVVESIPKSDCISCRPQPENEPPAPGQPQGKPALQSVSQLASMAKLDNDVAVAAESIFTVSSGYEGVRLDALTDDILRSITDLPPSALAAIRAYRQGRIERDEMDLQLAATRYHTGELAASWRVVVSATLPSGYTETHEAVVILPPDGDVPYIVADWRRI